jgi:predicted aspartyl protease
VTSSLLAQSQQSPGFYLKSNKKSIRIPFEWQSNLIIVPIKINKSDTLNFILDTGISMILLTEPSVASALNLKYVRKVNVMGVGEGEALSAQISVNNTIELLPEVTANQQNIVSLSEDILHLSNYVGMPIHGIFGFDLFKHFVVRIDFVQKMITLYRPDRYVYRGKGEKIPIIIEETKPYLYAKAIWADNREVPIKVILDTGAGHALSLDMGTHEQIQLPDKIIRAQLGRGLNGIINGSLGRIEKIQIGRYEFANVITSFPDTTTYGMQMAKRLNRQGNIGCEVLKRFDIIFDYSRNYVVLKPNKKFYKESFERDMSGIDVRARGNDFHTFVIDRLEENSPAADAGLKEGDEIISINGKMASQLRLSEILKVLQKGAGKEVKIFVRRGHELFYTSFVLRRMI